MWRGPGANPRAHKLAGLRRQGGVVMLMYVGAALTVIGMAGLALDLGNVYLAKTRLQNAMDAAALDGAKALLLGQSVSAATTTATSTFNTNFGASLLSTGTLTIQTSVLYAGPYVGAAATGKFVKVTVANVPVRTYLINVFRPGNTQAIGGTAIGGPQGVGQTCGAIPVAICAKNTTDTDCSDGTCFGYSTGVEFTTQDKAALGAGNWGLVQLNCDAEGNCTSNVTGSGGGAEIRDAMGGGKTICFKAGGSLPTKPGATTGPVDQGVNCRFNDCGGGLDQNAYPGDKVTQPRAISTPYATYAALVAAGTFDNANGQLGRRVSAAPVVDCSGGGTGTTSTPVLGTMCLFLTKEASGGDLSVEMISTCRAEGGTPDPTPDPTGAQRIVLYQSSTTS